MTLFYLSSVHRVVLSSIVLAVGCASGPSVVDVGPPEPRVLSEAQALLVIESTLDEASVAHGREIPLDLGEGPRLLADLHLGRPTFAIEWVSSDDRRVHGSALPQGVENGPLRIVTARDGDGNPVQALVLDQNAYVFEGNPRRVQRGAPGMVEAEERLRRDVIDYTQYVRSQGALEP
jgi:hypothetical protein